MRTMAALLLLAPMALADDFPPCSAENRTCPSGLECDIITKRCYHYPRQLGEPCGIFQEGRHCAEYDKNTTFKMDCSTWCGVCVLKDQQERLETSTTPQEKVHKQHMERLQRTTERCGLTANVSYANFEQTLITTMPIVYPHNDDELGRMLTIIAKNRCIARPVGATHTSSTVITSLEETNTVGISLAEYVPDDRAWAGVLNVTSSSVRAPAGWSLFDLYQLIRPKGYFLPTQTAGPIFTLAGIVTNTVHGGVFNAGFVSEYVRALRVTVWNSAGAPEVRVITDESELRHWRNSFGLLGIITGIDFQLSKRDTFMVTTGHHKFEPFTRETVDEYFNTLEKSYLYSESFFDPYLNEIDSVLFKRGDVIPPQCSRITDDLCKWDYPKAHCANEECCHYQYKFGDINLSESCRAIYTPQRPESDLQQAYAGLAKAMSHIRYVGAPDLPPNEDAQMCLLDWVDKVKMGPLEDVLAYAYYDRTYVTLDSSVQQNSIDVNDGFYLRAVPHPIRLVAYFVPRKNLFDMLMIIKNSFEEVSKATGIKQLGNAEFRFLNITDKATLFPTGALSGQPKTGQYVNLELVFLTFPGNSDRLWAEMLAKYEEGMRALDGFAHLGKSFCYEKNTKGEWEPYLNQTCVKSMFNSQQKATFQGYHATADPHNLFWGGAAKEFF